MSAGLFAFKEVAQRVSELDLDGFAPGTKVRHVEIGEYADGSGRTYALATVITPSGRETAFRVLSPAPDGCPNWASRFDWTTSEVRP